MQIYVIKLSWMQQNICFAISCYRKSLASQSVATILNQKWFQFIWICSAIRLWPTLAASWDSCCQKPEHKKMCYFLFDLLLTRPRAESRLLGPTLKIFVKSTHRLWPCVYNVQKAERQQYKTLHKSSTHAGGAQIFTHTTLLKLNKEKVVDSITNALIPSQTRATLFFSHSLKLFFFFCCIVRSMCVAPAY